MSYNYTSFDVVTEGREIEQSTKFVFGDEDRSTFRIVNDHYIQTGLTAQAHNFHVNALKDVGSLVGKYFFNKEQEYVSPEIAKKDYGIDIKEPMLKHRVEARQRLTLLTERFNQRISLARSGVVPNWLQSIGGGLTSLIGDPLSLLAFNGAHGLFVKGVQAIKGGAALKWLQQGSLLTRYAKRVSTVGVLEGALGTGLEINRDLYRNQEISYGANIIGGVADALLSSLLPFNVGGKIPKTPIDTPKGDVTPAPIPTVTHKILPFVNVKQRGDTYILKSDYDVDTKRIGDEPEALTGEVVEAGEQALYKDLKHALPIEEVNTAEDFISLLLSEVGFKGASPEQVIGKLKDMFRKYKINPSNINILKQFIPIIQEVIRRDSGAAVILGDIDMLKLLQSGNIKQDLLSLIDKFNAAYKRNTQAPIIEAVASLPPSKQKKLPPAKGKPKELDSDKN